METTARWSARVTRATGRPIAAAGSTCAIEAQLGVNRGSAQVPHLRVLCGSTPVYDSADALEGMSMSGSSVLMDGSDHGDQVRFALAYDDKGTRTGRRSEITLDTTSGSGAVWRDSAPAFRIELAPASWSEPVDAAAIAASTGEILRRAATVTEVSGKAPVRIGASCDLRVTPQAAAGRCLARLSCARRVLYAQGSGGNTECTLAAGRVAHAVDHEPTAKDQDPEIDVDVETGKLVLADEVAGARWTVTMNLAPAP